MKICDACSVSEKVDKNIRRVKLLLGFTDVEPQTGDNPIGEFADLCPKCLKKCTEVITNTFNLFLTPPDKKK